MEKIFLKKIDYYLPKKIEKNINILKLVGKNKNDSLNIIEKIGIKQRHISNKNEFSNDLGIKAARKILQNFNKNKINFLIYCTNTPDYLLPSNSCLIHEKLNLKPSSGAFDIILACSGYVYALGLAKSLIKSGEANNILLITSDTYSKFIPLNDSKNRILFGDGASCTLITNKKSKNSYEICNSIYGTDGKDYKFAIMKNFGNKYRNSKIKKDNFLFLDGPGLYNFALKRIPNQLKIFLKKNKLEKNQIDHYVFHQANKFMLDGVQKVMNIPKNKVIIDMAKTGNTTSSSIPIALKKNEKKFKKGDKILLAAFGGGLSWGISLIKKN